MQCLTQGDQAEPPENARALPFRPVGGVGGDVGGGVGAGVGAVTVTAKVAVAVFP